jgi:uncharacterized protein (DUF4415 family)
MRRDGNIVSYTVEELNEMAARGEDLTDWEAVKALTDEEVEAAVDFEDEGVPIWETAMPVSFNFPGFGQRTIRLDEDILDWFKTHGVDHEAKINAVLRAYMDAHGDDDAKPTRRKAS